MVGSSFEPPVNGANRFAHIDALRAYAVLVVVLAHAGLGHVIPGGSGVTVFFSISGFIITFLVLRERDKTGGFSIGSFYARRAIKILPPLFFAIALPTLIYQLWKPISWRDFAGEIFFYYNWIKADGGGDVLPGSGVVWSLSIEEQFYIVFALIWIILVKVKYWKQILACIAVFGILSSTLLRIVLVQWNESASRIYYGSDTRLDGIAWGILVAIAYHSWLSRGGTSSRGARFFGHPFSFLLAIFLYLASLSIRDELFRDTFRFSLQSISTCLIIAYGLMPGGGFIRTQFYRVSQSSFVSRIGLASYSIYLVHLVIMSQLFLFTASWPMPLTLAFLASIGVGVGYLMYIYVEVPVMRLKARRTKTVGGVQGRAAASL
ncbi:putative acyltransferase [Rhodococcus opacus]|uniref:Putative acyltransferase n=1 Tax=Rhodococcus opacus TaxID=37919 RepID=A0A1B1K1E4_RHOOP|nr:acyltransferase [Rhodococcus opacus]ANS26435.1 putative acyltransferase [Rhodococcus opacus]